MSTDDRTLPERITFGVSLAILAVVVLLIALQMPGEDAPAAPVASVDEVRRVGARFHVLVDVSNEGDETAADTQVSAELDIDGDVTSADQTIDFLAGGESRSVVFVFDDDPADGELTVSVGGYTIP